MENSGAPNADIFLQSLIITLSSALLFILYAVFLYSTSGELRIRSLRLYSTTLATGFAYVALAYLDTFEQVGLDLVGSDPGDDADKRETNLKAIRIALSATFYLTATSYFFSTIFDLNYRPTSLSSTRHEKGSGGFNLIYLPAFFIASVFLFIKYGILPSALAIIVLTKSLHETIPELDLLVKAFNSSVDAALTSPAYLKIKESIYIVIDEFK